MRFTADFHIHSKYSRATSRDCVPEMLDLWARRKGLHLIGTGDFTHPAWREELREKLITAEEGLYVLKDEYRVDGNALSGALPLGPAAAGAMRRGSFDSAFDSDSCRPRFILSAEISSIYKKNGKTRKVHNVILLPGLEQADELSHRLEQIGNLHSDGRPILGLDSRDLLEITLEVCPEAVFIPAHIWTPHFSLFGAYSGFDRIEDCFEDLTPYIHSLETGLSSDPPMNWRISALDRFTLVSNSDAHSPSKLAREANLFDTELSYSAISNALSHPETGAFLGTLEFYPEEGKYHMDGHRNCKVCLKPSETIAAAGVCPVCGRKITVGVLHRVEELADREDGYRPPLAKDFESIIPLPEVIDASLGLTAASKKVQGMYEELLRKLGSELPILRQVPIEELERLGGPCVAEGIRRIRAGEVRWEPGYDGEYGKVTLLDAGEISCYSGQMSFFSMASAWGTNKEEGCRAEKGAPEDGAGGAAAGSETGSVESAAAGSATGSGLRSAVDPAAGSGEASGPGSAAEFAASSAEMPVGCLTAGLDQHAIAAGDESAGSGESHEIPSAGDRLYGLNSEQWAAAGAEDRAIAVIAGPGTGKTKTLVCHIRYLIEERKVPAAQITAVTFTNKAAVEMRQRLQQELADKRAARKVNIGTFHGICLDLLKRWRGSVTLADETEALAVAEEAGKALGITAKPRDLLQAISDRKNGAAGRGSVDIPDELFDRYCTALRECGALDFDDLLLEVLRAFGGGESGIEGAEKTGGTAGTRDAAETECTAGMDSPGAFCTVSEKELERDRKLFNYLLVDEFQDINQVQYQLLKVWSAENEELFVIGDPDQSIYGFRGSDARCFQKFAEAFPERRTIRLSRNYRSTPEILNCALPVINRQELPEAARPAGGRDGQDERRGAGGRTEDDEQDQAAACGLGPGSASGGRVLTPFRGSGRSVRVLTADSPFSEALYVAKEINRMVGGIDMLDAHLQGSGRDREAAVSGFSDIAVLYRTHRQSALLEECFHKEGIPYIVTGRDKFLEDKNVRIAMAFFRYLLDPDDGTACRRVAAALGEDRLSQLAGGFSDRSAAKEKPWKLLDTWIAENGLAGEPEMGRLRSAAVLHKTMPEFLQNLALGQEGDVSRSGGKVYQSDAVSLMTLHGSKGLEFPVVFLCGVKSDTIPLRSFKGHTDVEEERRLFYVGMTRAKDELTLLTEKDTPSPFLEDIPERAAERGVVWERPRDDGKQLSFF